MLKMPKFPKDWGVSVPARDEGGQIIYESNGKPCMITKHMANASFGGQPQSLYYPNTHPTLPGKFKGMAKLLEERGYHDASQLQAQCKGFKC
jgi:hypothetical protein